MRARANIEMMTDPDPLRDLVAAATAGDERALTAFIRETQPAVWRLCTRLGTKGDEADLVQDTYLRAIRALPSFRGDAPARAWLLSIARRVCADHVRHAQRRRRLTERVAQHTEMTAHPAHDGADDLLDLLDTDRREAFVLTQYVGLSYEEAAVVADCAVGTIRSRVARARADLLRALRRAEEAR